MKHLGIDEFRERAIDYLTSGETLAIEHEGKIVGFYFPKEKTREEELKRAVDRLSQAVERAMVESGMTEDELADLFDLSQPFQL